MHLASGSSAMLNSCVISNSRAGQVKGVHQKEMCVRGSWYGTVLHVLCSMEAPCISSNHLP